MSIDFHRLLEEINNTRLIRIDYIDYIEYLAMIDFHRLHGHTRDFTEVSM